MQKPYFYYKLIRNDDGEELYVKTDLPIKPEKLCETLSIDDIWHAECITEEEYNSETEDE